jgi:hypothetical protein
MMPGTILSHFLPFRINAVVFGLYDYLVPIMLYCAWSTLAFLDLARGDWTGAGRGRSIRWAAVVLAIPALGAVGYLTLGRSGISRGVRLGAVAGGVALVVLSYTYTMVRIG